MEKIVKENKDTIEEFKNKLKDNIKDDLKDELKENLKDDLKDNLQEEYDQLKEICFEQSDLISILQRKNKRLETELEYKNEDILKKLIPVLDDISLVESNEKIPEGVKLIFNKLINVLKEIELEEFTDDEYKVFNDDLHNAIDIKYYDNNIKIPEGFIDSVQRIGYRYKDKVIRHSDVIVAKNK